MHNFLFENSGSKKMYFPLQCSPENSSTLSVPSKRASIASKSKSDHGGTSRKLESNLESSRSSAGQNDLEVLNCSVKPELVEESDDDEMDTSTEDHDHVDDIRLKTEETEVIVLDEHVEEPVIFLNATSIHSTSSDDSEADDDTSQEELNRNIRCHGLASPIKLPVKVAPKQFLVTSTRKIPIASKSLPINNLHKIHPKSEYVLVNTNQMANAKFSPSSALHSKTQIVEKSETPKFQKCDICGDKFLVGQTLKNHLKCHVGPDYVFYCDTCKHGFVSSFRLNTFHHKHVSCPEYNRVKDLNHECPLCPYSNTDTKMYKKHLEHHEVTAEEKNFPCPQCPAKFACRKSVETHLEGKHLCHSTFERQKCEVCRILVPISKIKEHLRLEHDLQDSITCKLCSAEYITVEQMITHQMRHRKRSKIMACHLCDEKYTFLRDFHVHYFTAHGIGQKLSCEKCKWESFSEFSFKRHQKNCPQEHKDSTSNAKAPRPRRLNCPDCLKVFSTLDYVLQHRIKEHGHPPIKCPYTSCDKTFQLRRHLKIHTISGHRGISFCKETLRCEHCGDVFQSTREIEQHKSQKHSEERPFVCDTCGKGFKLHTYLQSHIKVVHLKKKKPSSCSKTVCDTCGKSIAHSRFKEHLRTHTKERPYTCTFCGQKFRQRISWTTHVRSHERLGDKFKPKGEMERGVRKTNS